MKRKIAIALASLFAVVLLPGLVWTLQTKKENMETLSRGFAAMFSVSEISIAQLRELQGEGTPYLLIDMRTHAEQSVSQIPGAVLSTPQASITELPEYREFISRHETGQVIAYCAGGYRSARQISQSDGNLGQSPFNLRGGIIAYANAGGALVDANGNPTERVHTYDSSWAPFLNDSLIAVTEPPVSPGPRDLRVNHD